MPDGEYARLYRLSREDFVQIGCTKAELAEVDKMNQRLNELEQKMGQLEKLEHDENKPDSEKKPGEYNLPPDEMKEHRNLYEKLYVTFLDAAERNPKNWEYAPSALPVWLQSSGKINLMDRILRSYGDQLPLADKVRVLKRREVSIISKQLESEQKKQPRENPHEVQVTDKGVFLKGVEQTQFQNSNNGCWSVSASLLINSRGVKKVTQNEVRAFRPEYNAKEAHDVIFTEKPTEKEIEKGITTNKMDSTNKEAFALMNSDIGNNIIERGDAFLKLAPGSMLQGIQINGYDVEARRAGLTREEYLQNAKNVVTANIRHAIIEEKSPISFLKGGHYITITGITNDGFVEYKDSRNFNKGDGPDKTRRVKLDTLLNHLIDKSPKPVSMEWAADIKLSKDGKTLYGVPTQYLNVGEDGSLIRPNSLRDDANVIKSFQQHTGTYIKRDYQSEGIDEQASRDEYLQNGGVNLVQRAYLPEKLDMEALKLKAELRSEKDEKHLQEDSKNFYNVEYKKDAPAETKESMNEKYNSMKSAFFNNKQNSLTQDIVNLAKTTSTKEGHPDHVIGNEYVEYVNRLYNTQAEGYGQMKEYMYKDLLCKGILAAKMDAAGIPFNEDAINKNYQSIKNYPAVDNMSKEEVQAILALDKRHMVFSEVYKELENGAFKVEQKYQKGYFREIESLAQNMMPKEGRSPEYGRYYDAVQTAAGLDKNDPDLDNKIAKANREILDSAEAYAKGKKSTRHSKDGQARFDNTLDGVSIVSTFAPKGCLKRGEKLFVRVNEVRGLDAKHKLSMLNFGGDNAKTAAAERKGPAKQAGSAK